jgi:hypothetical protein
MNFHLVSLWLSSFKGYSSSNYVLSDLIFMIMGIKPVNTFSQIHESLSLSIFKVKDYHYD